MLLGVNIDHIAVLREARRINDPDPIDALGIANVQAQTKSPYICEKIDDTFKMRMPSALSS